MRTFYRILLRLSIVLGVVAVGALAVSVIANREAVFGTGRYVAFDPSTAVPINDLPVPPGYGLPSAINQEKDGSLSRAPIPIDRTKSSWREATRAGCVEAARDEKAPWCDYGPPVPDAGTFDYCTKSGAPAWCRGMEKMEPDRRLATAEVAGIVWDDAPKVDFRAARHEALISAFFVPGLIGSAALAVLSLAWILKPPKTQAVAP